MLTDVRSNFYDVLVAQRAVELTEELVRIGDAGARTADALMKEKEVGRGDVLQARIESDSAKVFLERARQSAHGCLAPTGCGGRRFRHGTAAVGRRRARRLGSASLGRHSQSSALSEPRTGRGRGRCRTRQAALRRECAGRYPNVDLQAAVQYDNSTYDTFGSVQVGVPVPIYNRNQGNIRRAQADLMAAQSDAQRIQLALQQRLGRTFEQYANAVYQVEKYKQNILPAAEESLTLTNEGYRQGEFNYLSLLTAQRTFFQTNLAYLNALRELRASATAIEGNLLGDSLQVGVSSGDGVLQEYSGGSLGILSDLFERK